jgi:hypothetical protein
VNITAALARWRVALGFIGGIAALVLAKPSWTSLTIGVSIALVGEALRWWAAGHLEKSREVTQSGPYRLMRHPLYVGSSIVGAGFAVATWHPVVAAIAALYLGTTIPAAIRAEEAHLREKFGDAYDAYAERATDLSADLSAVAPSARVEAFAKAEPVPRAFSVRRALYNREHHTLAGLLGVMALLALKIAWGG